MDNGNPSRVSGGRRRAGRGGRRVDPRGSIEAGRHRAAGTLSLRPSRFHIVAVLVGCLLATGGIAVGASVLGGDDPGSGAGEEQAAPLLYADGEAVPDDFLERRTGLGEQIHAELEARYGIGAEDLYDGGTGYRVVLTLDRAIQEAAEAAAAPAGVVAVEPGSGAVLCYYGGEDEAGVDQVGPAEPHPPSSVFDMVIAATALENGASLESWWSDADADVTLTDAVRESRPVAVDAVAAEYGTEAVLDTAIRLGLTAIADKGGTVHDFEDGDTGEAAQDLKAVEFGSYAVSVLDMAAVYATIANDGVHARTHFVERVLDESGNTVEANQGIPTAQAVATETARDLQFLGLGNGDAIEDREFFGLAGTWNDNTAHSWYVGAIPQLSVAAWVGHAEAGERSGIPVWRQVMDSAIEVMEYEPEPWPGAAGAGSDLTDGIEDEDGGIDPDSEYCRADPDVPA
ncbi:MAG TPA: penicillin-binding transpeptidase domain-containing protein, partial [Glycomyces sp.]|nr:penicillin-binding transpeptidase domain-containing protein [Glycomyces sp.]